MPLYAPNTVDSNAVTGAPPEEADDQRGAWLEAGRRRDLCRAGGAARALHRDRALCVRPQARAAPGHDRSVRPALVDHSRGGEPISALILRSALLRASRRMGAHHATIAFNAVAAEA